MKALVGIIMGSSSDWETMRCAAETLEKLGVPHEVKVVSAHRTPDLLFEYAASARSRGLEVIIAGAGGAAHLPGMTAAKTSLPVLGVPVQSKTLGGLDSLLSIVQMPAGVPVATFAIGAAGATNAALCAAAILANKYPAVAEALGRFRDSQTAGVLANPDPRDRAAVMTVGIVGAGQLGRMLALAGYPLGLDFLFLDPARDAPAGRVAPVLHGPFTDPKLLSRLARDCEVLTFDWENISVAALRGHAARGRRRAHLSVHRGSRHRAGPCCREASVRTAAAFRRHAGGRSGRAHSWSGRCGMSALRGSSRRGVWVTTARDRSR